MSSETDRLLTKLVTQAEEDGLYSISPEEFRAAIRVVRAERVDMTSDQATEIKLPTLPDGMGWKLAYNEDCRKILLYIKSDGDVKAAIEVACPSTPQAIARELCIQAKALVERLEMITDVQELLGL